MKNFKHKRKVVLEYWDLKFVWLLSLGVWSLPGIGLAHEVYVLQPGQIATDISEPPFDMVATLMTNLHQVIFWAFIGFVLVSTVFFMSIFRLFETRSHPFFMRIRPYASTVARVTVGLGFIAGGYFGATYGPELPLAISFGGNAHLVSLALSIIGVLMVVGFWARAAAIAALALFLTSIYQHGIYMLTYINYLGEIIVLLIIGSHRASIHSLTGWSETFYASFQRLAERMKSLAFPILRVCFGVSLIYSSVYAKIIHNNLALQVASLPLAGHAHGLAYYFGFEPHFMVLGAAIIEIVIGLFFIFGIEIRWTSIFLLFWLTLSLWYFQESVWPHVILIGIPIAFIMHGYDKYSIEGYFFKNSRREPVL